jgi:hypothetical protein
MCFQKKPKSNNGISFRSGSDSAKDINYEMVPRQKGIFKLRSNVEKKVVVSVQQVRSNQKLSFEFKFD